MKIRRATVLILTVGLFLPILAADLQSEPRGQHLFFNFSIFYPVSINQSRYDSTNINLSLFYGRVGQVHGFDLAAGASVVEDEVKGLQVAGLAGVCGSGLTGGQIAGLFAVAGDELSGVQVSGLFNVCGEEGEGLQASSFMNVTGNSFRGIQAAGFMNVVGEESKGLQAAGLMNVTGNTYQGRGSVQCYRRKLQRSAGCRDIQRRWRAPQRAAGRKHERCQHLSGCSGRVVQRGWRFGGSPDRPGQLL
jgi:hypothetical protein